MNLSHINKLKKSVNTHTAAYVNAREPVAYGVARFKSAESDWELMR